MIYLDHAASTPLLSEACSQLCQSLQNDFANPSSAHRFGSSLSKRIDKIRSYFLDLLKLDQEEFDFIFTASATESNNMVILNQAVGSSIFLNQAFHSSLKAPVINNDYKLNYLPRDGSHHLDAQWLKTCLNKDSTGLLLLEWVNGQSGIIENIAEMASLAKQLAPHLWIHVDAVQGFGKIPFPMNSLKFIDSIAISGHKIGGPKGIAGLYFRRHKKLRPLIWGGGQENGMRSGTQAFPLISSFMTAAKIMHADREQSVQVVSHLQCALRSRLEKIQSISFPVASAQTSPYIQMLMIEGASSDILLRHLEVHEIIMSSTSACSSKLKGFNPVFADFGIEEQNHKNILRVSFSASNTIEEVEIFSRALEKILCDLKRLTRKA